MISKLARLVPTSSSYGLCFTPYSRQNLLLFLNIILDGERWNPNVVTICTFLLANEVYHFSRFLLVICVPLLTIVFLVHCTFCSRGCHFSSGYFWNFCENSHGYSCMGLYLGPLFYSIDLCVHLYHKYLITVAPL